MNKRIRTTYEDVRFKFNTAEKSQFCGEEVNVFKSSFRNARDIVNSKRSRDAFESAFKLSTTCEKYLSTPMYSNAVALLKNLNEFIRAENESFQKDSDRIPEAQIKIKDEESKNSQGGEETIQYWVDFWNKQDMIVN